MGDPTFSSVKYTILFESLMMTSSLNAINAHVGVVYSLRYNSDFGSFGLDPCSLWCEWCVLIVHFLRLMSFLSDN